jgi:PhnB protein
MSNACIQPWLTFKDCFEALRFYKVAFGAEERYHLEPAEGELVCRLSIEGAEFWISSDASGNVGEHSRFIIVVRNPEDYCSKAIEAGAKEIFPVREEHGWRTGKIEDPFGHQWEFGFETMA